MGASTTPASKKKVTIPMLGLEEVYFTLGTLSNATRYTTVVDNSNYVVALYFWDQVTVTARAVEELKAPAFVKLVCPVRIY